MDLKLGSLMTKSVQTGTWNQTACNSYNRYNTCRNLLRNLKKLTAFLKKLLSSSHECLNHRTVGIVQSLERGWCCQHEFQQKQFRFLPLDPRAYLQSFWQRALLFGLGPVDELSCRTCPVSRLKHLYKEIGKHSFFFFWSQVV